MNEMESDLIGE